jgi:hypothetical protein
MNSVYHPVRVKTVADTTEDIKHSNTDGMPPLQSGLSFLGNIGIIIIVVAFVIGVADPTANSAAVGLLVLSGIACLLGAIFAWIFVVQPHKHFDDINVPQYTGHHHEEAHDDSAPAAHH